MSDHEKPIGVAVLGLGNVGREVVRIIEQSAPDLAARIGAPLALRTGSAQSSQPKCANGPNARTALA